MARCEDCPPIGYPTDKTRCLPCPLRADADKYARDQRWAARQARKHNAECEADLARRGKI